MDDLDFDLKIGKRNGLDYLVEAVRSPTGEREATMPSTIFFFQA